MTIIIQEHLDLYEADIINTAIEALRQNGTKVICFIEDLDDEEAQPVVLQLNKNRLTDAENNFYGKDTAGLEATEEE